MFGLAFLAACETRPVRVGSHTFVIPGENLEMPPSDGGFHAILNPEEQRSRVVSLLVEERTDLAACRGEVTPIVDAVPRACAAAASGRRQPDLGPLSKRLRFPDDPTQYDYVDADGHVGASCTGEQPGQGSCLSVFAWRDLICSLRFNEVRVPDLDRIRHDMEAGLQRWAQGD